MNELRWPATHYLREEGSRWREQQIKGPEWVSVGERGGCAHEPDMFEKSS